LLSKFPVDLPGDPIKRAIKRLLWLTAFGSWLWPKAGKVVKLTTNLKQFLCGSRTNGSPPPLAFPEDKGPCHSGCPRTFGPLVGGGMGVGGMSCHVSGQ